MPTRRVRSAITGRHYFSGRVAADRARVSDTRANSIATSTARLDAVIFDVDGTLVDSERNGHRVAFNHAFAAMGMSDHWNEAYYGELLKITGGRRRIYSHLVKRGVQPAESCALSDELHRIKTVQFRKMVSEGAVPLIPGVGQLVSDLQRNSVRLFVATTGSPHWVQPLLGRHFGDQTFECVVTSADVRELKPSPDVYLTVLRRAGLRSDRVVAIEDSANGLRAAHGADIPCLVVRNDYTWDDVGEAELVVSGFGPDSRFESGVDAPLPHGLVTIDTLNALVGLRPTSAQAGARPRKRWFRRQDRSQG